jgi:hypothetical protein
MVNLFCFQLTELTKMPTKKREYEKIFFENVEIEI